MNRMIAILILIFSVPLISKEKRQKKIIISVNLSTKGNNIEFDQKAIEFPFGNIVELKFKNLAHKDSQIDHNVIVIKPGSLNQFIKELQLHSYDIQKLKSNPKVVAISEKIAPGESTSIVFEPSQKGFYHYLCTMPGHGDMLGMKGLMHVK